MTIKEQIRHILKDNNALRYHIRTKSKPKEEVDKKTFLNIIKLMKEINDRSEFLVTEIGIDSVAYEDKFFQVIEGLMYIAFNKKQVLLIDMYINDIAHLSEDWDGTITVELNKKEEVIDFKTPEDVWEAIQKFK
jgi:hypothetical protein